MKMSEDSISMKDLRIEKERLEKESLGRINDLKIKKDKLEEQIRLLQGVIHRERKLKFCSQCEIILISENTTACPECGQKLEVEIKA